MTNSFPSGCHLFGRQARHQPVMVWQVLRDLRIRAIGPSAPNGLGAAPTVMLRMAIEERQVGALTMSIRRIIKPPTFPNNENAIVNRLLVVVNKSEHIRRAGLSEYRIRVL